MLTPFAQAVFGRPGDERDPLVSEGDQPTGCLARGVLVAHHQRNASALAQRADPGIGHPLLFQQTGYQGIVRVRRREDNPVGLKRRERCVELALDMVIVRVDQFDDHAVAMLGALEHAPQKHLIDPVRALACPPGLDRAVAIVERKDQVRARPAHPLCCDRGNVAQPVDRGLHAFAHLVAHIGFSVDHPADRLQRDACVSSDMLDRDRLAPSRHRLAALCAESRASHVWRALPDPRRGQCLPHNALPGR